MPLSENVARARASLSRHGLHTVCEEARCPNRAECWSRGSATFLILGDVCSRNCGFCAVKSGTPGFPDPLEPEKVAEAAAALGLRHVVITSVTRDDLPDGGASLFAGTLRQVRDRVPGATVEVLIPDFRGSEQALATVMRERPEILNHNVETVPRLYPQVRPQARYDRSLEVLRRARELDPCTRTKSGLMVGLGERGDEISTLMADLRRAGCDVLTIGQYLQPDRDCVPVVRYYRPEEFLLLKQEALAAGFSWVESGPQVRSSFNAEAQARALARTRAPGHCGDPGAN
jgi:lipoyl synthase